MGDFEIRPMTRDDAQALADVLVAAEAVDRTEEHYGLDDVLEELDNQMIEVERDWLVAEVSGTVVAHSRLMPRAPADGALSLAIDGVVHPDHRRRGIGTALVPRLVERAHAYVAERGPDLRPIVTGTAPSDLGDVARLFAANGLVPDRWSFLMLADLHALPDGETPTLPEGYTLGTWEGLEDAEILAVHNRSFVDLPGWTPWDAPMWETWVSGSRAFRPALSLLARDETGAVAAYVQTNEYDAVAEATGLREAYVVKVGATPEHRRLGLASTLLAIALERFREEGFARAGLDVDSENPTGALAIYERVGFEVQRRWTSYLLKP